MEPANSGKGLVHIRCCYNNKYWRRWTDHLEWIAAAADEPEEDESKWSCTLFQPIYEDVDAKTLQIMHVQVGDFACLWRGGGTYGSCLCAGPISPVRRNCDVYTIIDWESLVMLPKHVAFKGNNGRYLEAYADGDQKLQFVADDIGNEGTGDEVFTTHDGSIRIKNKYFGQFWRCRDDSSIWADADDTTSNNLDTMFWPIKVDDNVIALRSLGNSNFCRRLTADGCLDAALPTITREARIRVEERVISRQIYNVKFRLTDARIYNQRDLTLATGVAMNTTKETIDKAEVKLSWTDTKSSTWNSSVSLKLGVKTSIQTGIPVIIDGKIEISGVSTEACGWGETKKSATEEKVDCGVTVPPVSMAIVRLIAKMGSCDVPFSYSQRDTLTDGNQITYDMDDGVYTGVNAFDHTFRTKLCSN